MKKLLLLTALLFAFALAAAPVLATPLSMPDEPVALTSVEDVAFEQAQELSIAAVDAAYAGSWRDNHRSLSRPASRLSFSLLADRAEVAVSGTSRC